MLKETIEKKKSIKRKILSNIEYKNLTKRALS